MPASRTRTRTRGDAKRQAALLQLQLAAEKAEAASARQQNRQNRHSRYGARTRSEFNYAEQAFTAEVGRPVANLVNDHQRNLIAVETRVWLPPWATLREGIKPWALKIVQLWLRTHLHPSPYCSIHNQVIDYIYQCWPTLSAQATYVDIHVAGEPEPSPPCYPNPAAVTVVVNFERL